MGARVASVAVEIHLEGRRCGDGSDNANVFRLLLQLGSLVRVGQARVQSAAAAVRKGKGICRYCRGEEDRDGFDCDYAAGRGEQRNMLATADQTA